MTQLLNPIYLTQNIRIREYLLITGYFELKNCLNYTLIDTQILYNFENNMMFQVHKISLNNFQTCNNQIPIFDIFTIFKYD